MIILGVILLLIGLFVPYPLLVTVGLIVGGVGLLLLIIGATGHEVGGRRFWL